MSKIITTILIGLINVYRWGISPFLPVACRYEPSCSQYGKDAISKHGPFKGSFLTVKRICSCNPWGGHGYDPVP